MKEKKELLNNKLNDIEQEINNRVKEKLEEHGIAHSTIEFEEKGEKCDSENCEIKNTSHSHHHHHHH